MDLRYSIPAVLIFLAGAVQVADAQSSSPPEDRQEIRDRERIIDSLYNPRISEAGTVMDFVSEVIDAGEMDEDGGPQEYEFRWTNTGGTPVSVVKVTTTCGCAVPSFDRSPVMPGTESSLKVTYHPKGHPGKFDRRIFVYTDLSGTSPAAVLFLKGNVRAASAPVWLYRFQMGSLYLRRTEIRFEGSARAVERIMCMNAGPSPLTVGVETALLPPFLSFRCEPETIPPGGEADIVISYDPEAVPVRMMNYVPVILTGIDLPPSQRTIKVVFGSGRQ